MADINQVQLPDGSQYNIKDSNSGYATETYVQNQISGITKATIGLGNVNNTSDMNKPVSTAQQTALNGKTNTSVIAYTESSATATKRYEIGDQFILSGVLYTATAIIPNGDPIVVDTNCSASDTIVEQIPNVEGKANKTDLTSISESGATASQAISAGTYFYLDGTLARAITDIANGATFTLNTNYETVSKGGLNAVRPHRFDIMLGNVNVNVEYQKTLSEITGGEVTQTSQVKALTLNGVGGNMYNDYNAYAGLAGTNLVVMYPTRAQTGISFSITLWY